MTNPKEDMLPSFCSEWVNRYRCKSDESPGTIRDTSLGGHSIFKMNVAGYQPYLRRMIIFVHRSREARQHLGCTWTW